MARDAELCTELPACLVECVCVEQRWDGLCYIMRACGNLCLAVIWTQETEKGRTDRKEKMREIQRREIEDKQEERQSKRQVERGRRCILLNSLQGVVNSLENHLDNTHIHTAACYQYCFLQS